MEGPQIDNHLAQDNTIVVNVVDTPSVSVVGWLTYLVPDFDPTFSFTNC